MEYRAIDVVFSPSKVFSDVFNSPKRENQLGIVLLAGLLSAYVGYLVAGTLSSALFFFVANIFQWLIFTALVWFFELAHVKRRKSLSSTSFSQVASVTGKLWSINLLGNLLLAAMVLLYPHMISPLVGVIGLIGFIAGMILVLAWLAASYHLVRVVIGIEGGKLFLNWVFLLLINGFAFTFIAALTGLLFF